MYRIDYHIHTDFSVDSSQQMEELIIHAINEGFDEIALTDHIETKKDGSFYNGKYDYDLYVKKINNYKEKYKNKIKIVCGAELGLNPEPKRLIELNNFLNKYDIEFVIASTHEVHNLDLYLGNFFKNKPKEEAYNLYFEEVLKNIKIFNRFNVVGHLDFVSRYGTYINNSMNYIDYVDIIDKILIQLIENGKGLEVNSSGIRYKLNQVHPQVEILKRYKQLGGEVLTIGSDAHNKNDLGSGFNIAYEVIKESGFKYITRFLNYKADFIKII